MKRVLTVLALALIAFSSAFADEKTEAIYNKFKDTKNCTALNLGGPMARLAMGGAARQLPKGTKISDLYVLGFEKEQCEDTPGIWSALDADFCSSMKTVADTTRDGARLKMFIEQDEEDITSLSVFIMDQSQNVSVVMFTGSIPKAAVDKMIKENTEKK